MWQLTADPRVLSVCRTHFGAPRQSPLPSLYASSLAMRSTTFSKHLLSSTSKSAHRAGVTGVRMLNSKPFGTLGTLPEQAGGSGCAAEGLEEAKAPSQTLRRRM